jgi:uncharacterized membrane protein YeiH
VSVLAQSAQYVGSIPLWMDVGAVALGAVSGSLTAVQRKFDVNGILMLAIVTGMGGGLLRDTLLQQGTPVGLTSRWMLPTAVAVGAVTFLFGRYVDVVHRRLQAVIVVVDAVFLGVYTVVGAAKALDAQLPGISCVLLGVLSGVGGGIVRDVLANDQPQVLRPGALYSVAATIGCGAFVAAVRVFDVSRYVGVAAIALIVAVRLLARWRNWETATGYDLIAEGRALPERVGRRLRARDQGRASHSDNS